MTEKLKSVREIYEGLSPSLRDKPFIVQRRGAGAWKEDTFFVVRRVAFDGSFRFFGDLFRNGRLIRSRKGSLLPLSSAGVWSQLPYSTVVCVAVQAGICPIYEIFCESVNKCSDLDEWISGIIRLSDEDDFD